MSMLIDPFKFAVPPVQGIIQIHGTAAFPRQNNVNMYASVQGTSMTWSVPSAFSFGSIAKDEDGLMVFMVNYNRQFPITFRVGLHSSNGAVGKGDYDTDYAWHFYHNGANSMAIWEKENNFTQTLSFIGSHVSPGQGLQMMIERVGTTINYYWSNNDNATWTPVRTLTDQPTGELFCQVSDTAQSAQGSQWMTGPWIITGDMQDTADGSKIQIAGNDQARYGEITPWRNRISVDGGENNDFTFAASGGNGGSADIYSADYGVISATDDFSMNCTIAFQNGYKASLGLALANHNNNTEADFKYSMRMGLLGDNAYSLIEDSVEVLQIPDAIESEAMYFQIQRKAGIVTYYQNGNLTYTSATSSADALKCSVYYITYPVVGTMHLQTWPNGTMP